MFIRPFFYLYLRVNDGGFTKNHLTDKIDYISSLRKYEPYQEKYHRVYETPKKVRLPPLDLKFIDEIKYRQKSLDRQLSKQKEYISIDKYLEGQRNQSTLNGNKISDTHSNEKKLDFQSFSFVYNQGTRKDSKRRDLSFPETELNNDSHQIHRINQSQLIFTFNRTPDNTDVNHSLFEQTKTPQHQKLKVYI